MRNLQAFPPNLYLQIVEVVSSILSEMDKGMDVLTFILHLVSYMNGHIIAI